MEEIMKWLVELNQNNHLGFGILTVVTMAGVGATIGGSIEVVFKLLGIGSEKIEIHH